MWLHASTEACERTESHVTTMAYLKTELGGSTAEFMSAWKTLGNDDKQSLKAWACRATDTLSWP